MKGDHPSISASTSIPNINGLIYQKILGDGHCLYNAVALYLGQTAPYLRRIVAAHIEANIEEFREFIVLPTGKTMENYVSDIREGREWADNIDIEVLMRLTNRPIVVIGPDGKIRDRGVLERFSGAPIFVYYNGHTHYDAFLQDSNFGPESVQKIISELTLFDEFPEFIPQHAASSSSTVLHQHSFFFPRELTQEHQSRLTLVRDDRCSITLEPLRETPEAELFQHIACGNQWLREGLESWIRDNDTCPVCHGDQICELVLIRNLTPDCTLNSLLPGQEIFAYVLTPDTFYYASAIDVPIVQQQIITQDPERINLIIDILEGATEQLTEEIHSEREERHLLLSDNMLRDIREIIGHRHIRSSIHEQAQIMGLIPAERQFNSYDYMKWLKLAIKNNNGRSSLLVLDQMLQMEPFRVQAGMCDKYGYSPLHYAVEMDELNALLVLLDAGVNLNVSSVTYGSPLHYAVTLGKPEMVRLLLHYGALQTHGDYFDGLPQNYTVRYFEENTRKHEYCQIIDSILFKIENTNYFFYSDESIATLIQIERHPRMRHACDQRICQFLTDEMQKYARQNSIRWTDYRRHDHGICLADLFHHWRDVCEHPLVRAIRDNDAEKKLSNFIRERMLFYQERMRIYQEIITIFETQPQELENIILDSNQVREYLSIQQWPTGWTALHAACIHGDLKKIDDILALGLSPNILDRCGNAPLHLLANSGYYLDPTHKNAIVAFLLNNGADLTLKNADGVTPLIICILTENTWLLVFLIKYLHENGRFDEDIQEEFFQFVANVAEPGSFSMLRALLTAYPDIIFGKNGNKNMLHVALRFYTINDVFSDGARVINALILSTCTLPSVSPLHAEIRNHPFCKNGVNKVDETGETPLFVAVRKGHFETIRYLIEQHKANVLVFNQDGYCIYQLAKILGLDVDIISYLREITLNALINVQNDIDDVLTFQQNTLFNEINRDALDAQMLIAAPLEESEDEESDNSENEESYYNDVRRTSSI